MEKFTLPALAKINWFLRVSGKRPDGFHEICTVFQTVSLGDWLTFVPCVTNRISLTCDNPAIPVDRRNLIIRAANGLREKFGIEKGAEIHLAKRIPSPGGLGGGSSDAAIALLGLAKLWEIPTGKTELAEIGKTLGADVPFFLTGGTSFGTGLGTEISAIVEICEKFMLIVTPDENVSTAEAYRSLRAPLLTNETSKSILQLCRDEANSSELLQAELQNDFEAVIFSLKPEIKRAKNELLRNGAKKSLMSGSGASVWGTFENETTRQIACENLRKEADWRIFAVETISRSEYLAQLAPCGKFLTDSA